MNMEPKTILYLVYMKCFCFTVCVQVVFSGFIAVVNQFCCWVVLLFEPVTICHSYWVKNKSAHVIVLWIWRAVWKDRLHIEDSFFNLFLVLAVSRLAWNTIKQKCSTQIKLQLLWFKSACCVLCCRCLTGKTLDHFHCGKVSTAAVNSGKHFVASAGCTHQLPWTALPIIL